MDIIGEKKNIIVTLTPTQNWIYNGTIDATVKINETRYIDSVNFFINVNIAGAGANLTSKMCSELNGKECADDEACSVAVTETFDSHRCCVPATACKKKQAKIPILGIIILGVVIAALIAVYLLVTRKKQKQMSEILEEAKKKYESKFQRGFPR